MSAPARLPPPAPRPASADNGGGPAGFLSGRTAVPLALASRRSRRSAPTNSPAKGPSMTAEALAPHDAGADDAPILSLRGIQKSFGAVHVLRGVDLEVRRGHVTALVGDNGAEIGRAHV